MKLPLFLIWLILNATFAMSATIPVVGDEWCPYNCKPSNKPGFMIKLAERIFEKSGHTIEYSVVPWKRAKLGIKDGIYDGIVGMTKNKTTEKLYVFPEQELGESQFCFYALSESQWEFTGVPSLKEIKLGVINGYGYGADGTPIEEYLTNNKDTPFVNAISGRYALKQIIKMILLERLTTVIEDSMVMEYTLATMGHQTKFKKVGCLEEVDRVHIAFSLKNPRSGEYAKILSKGIIELKKSGEYEEVINSYIQ